MGSTGEVVKVNNLVIKAKKFAHNGEPKKSLQLFKKAYNLAPSEKLSRRIAKLEEFIANMSDEESDDDDDTDMIDIGKQFFLHKSIENKLYDYQKRGVLWFWKLFRNNQGGILGDDMGLGKTIQVIAFMAGMFDAELIKHVIIVAPLSILVNWEKEFGKWAGGIRVRPFHGSSKKQRLKNLHKIQNTEGILITTYGMIVSSAGSLCVTENGEPFQWDYIILDEGHKIKNPTKTSKYVRGVPAKFHYILTGTPIQNNLNEMWSLFDFTQQGQLLGTRKTFDIEFQKPIVRAREKDASEYQQQVGNKIAETLRKLISPFFLRRTKAEVFNNSNNDETNKHSENNKEKKGPADVEAKVPKLKTKKNDLIIWLYLSDLQLKLYNGFVNSDRVKQCFITTRSPLAELNLLKKISDHPRLQSTLSKLLTSSAEQETRLACGITVDEEDEREDRDKEVIVQEAADAPPVEKLIKDSGKMVFLVKLMTKLKEEKHRTIIFSQSTKMLDIIQKVLLNDGHKILRVDGKITNPLDREKIVQCFQTDYSFNVMLMTTQVGSVGLTLTGADRLIIFDPSWNPGTDAQAVDRVYRVGQTRDVVIYRLITCGSIEEKIYRKQIFKNAIMKQATGCSKNPYRYFTNQELRELFLLDDPKYSTTQVQLKELHQFDYNDADVVFTEHLEFLNDLDCIFGVSHHDLLFSQEAHNTKNEEFEEAIEQQVNLAEQRVTEEINDLSISISTRKTQQSPEYLEQRPPPDQGRLDVVNELSVRSERNMMSLDVSMSKLCLEQHDNSSSRSKESTSGLTSLKNDSDQISDQSNKTSISDDKTASSFVQSHHKDIGSPVSHEDEEIQKSHSIISDELNDPDSIDRFERKHRMAGYDNVVSIDNTGENSNRQSSYEVVDVACSPVCSINEKVDESEDEGDDVSSHQIESASLESYEVTDMACSPIKSVNLSHATTNDNSRMSNAMVSMETSSNLSGSFIVNDMKGSSNSTPITTKYLPKAVQDLGRGYRTPPVSPVVSLLKKEGGRLMRDASTPVEFQNKLNFTSERISSTQNIDVTREIGDRSINRTRLTNSSANNTNLSTNQNTSRKEVSAERLPSQNESFYDSLNNPNCSIQNTRNVSINNKSMNQSINSNESQEGSDGTTNSGMSPSHNVTEMPSHDQSESREVRNTSVNRSSPNASTETSVNTSGKSTSSKDRYIESGDLAISIHISEESMGSLYETKDVSCSPMHSCDDVKSFQTGNVTCLNSDTECDSVFEKSDEILGEDNVVSDTETQTQASTSLYASDVSVDVVNKSQATNKMNYTNIGPSPSEHKRSLAATFFDVSSSDTSDHQPKIPGPSQYADTQPINITHCGDSPVEKSKSKVSIVLEDSTQDGDSFALNSTEESDVFDLDRLKRESIEDGGVEECVVVNDSLEVGENRENNEEGSIKKEDSISKRNDVTLDMTNSLNNETQGNELTERERYSKLLRLKSLLLKHMGNTDIKEKQLIKIVDLMDELNI